MSASKVGLRWFRVYSANRETRKAVGASTLKEFVTEGIETFFQLYHCIIYSAESSFQSY